MNGDGGGGGGGGDGGERQIRAITENREISFDFCRRYRLQD